MPHLTQSFAEEKQDELTMSALQMTLKDLLAHYMGTNEGIINMLEHYFDMNRKDAERSLELYRRFCWQTEKVVAFLDAARRKSYMLRSVIPSLNHAPLSLAGALEEYLNDPDFEENRSDFLRNRGKPREAKSTDSKSAVDAPQPNNDNKASENQRAEPAPAAPKANSSQKALQDFFEALEQPTSTPFQAAYSSFAGFNAQPDWFSTPSSAGFGMAPQATGINPFQPFPAAQPFVQPHPTGLNPFQQAPMQPVFPGASPAPAPLAPQHTMATTPFESIFGQLSLNSNSQPNQPGSQPPAAQQVGVQQQPIGVSFAPPANQPLGGPSYPTPFAQPDSGSASGTASQPLDPQRTAQPFAQPSHPWDRETNPTRPTAPAAPSSGPKLSFSEPPKSSSSSTNTPRIKPQKTGSMNPFSIPSDFEEPEPVVQQPKQPSLNELAMQSWFEKQPTVEEPKSMEQPSHDKPIAPPNTGFMSTIASEFARPNANAAPQNVHIEKRSATQPMGETTHGPHSLALGQVGASVLPSTQAPGQALHSQPTGTLRQQASSPFNNTGIPPPSGLGTNLESQRDLGMLPSTGLSPRNSLRSQSLSLGAQSTGARAPTSGLGSQPTGLGLHAGTGSQTGLGWQTGLSSQTNLGTHSTGLLTKSPFTRSNLGPQPTGLGSQSGLGSQTGLGSQPTGLGATTGFTGLSSNDASMQPNSPFSSRIGGGSFSSPSGSQLTRNNTSASLFTPSHPKSAGLGISSQSPGTNSPFAIGAGLASQTTGSFHSFSSPTLSPNLPNPHSPSQALQGQPTGLAGIKPFQPTSSFGHSLVSGNAPPPQPSPQSPQAQVPTQDLLQF